VVFDYRSDHRHRHRLRRHAFQQHPRILASAGAVLYRAAVRRGDYGHVVEAGYESRRFLGPAVGHARLGCHVLVRPLVPHRVCAILAQDLKNLPALAIQLEKPKRAGYNICRFATFTTTHELLKMYIEGQSDAEASNSFLDNLWTR